MISSTINYIKSSNYSPVKKDSPKTKGTTTVVPAKDKAALLEVGYSTKIGGMWTIKHEINSSKFYELFINTELKGDTSMDLKNLYNLIKKYLSAVTRLR